MIGCVLLTKMNWVVIFRCLNPHPKGVDDSQLLTTHIFQRDWENQQLEGPEVKHQIFPAIFQGLIREPLGCLPTILDTPRKTDRTMENPPGDEVWRCISYWKWWIFQSLSELSGSLGLNINPPRGCVLPSFKSQISRSRDSRKKATRRRPAGVVGWRPCNVLAKLHQVSNEKTTSCL